LPKIPTPFDARRISGLVNANNYTYTAAWSNKIEMKILYIQQLFYQSSFKPSVVIINAASSIENF